MSIVRSITLEVVGPIVVNIISDEQIQTFETFNVIDGTDNVIDGTDNVVDNIAV